MINKYSRIIAFTGENLNNLIGKGSDIKNISPDFTKFQLKYLLTDG